MNLQALGGQEDAAFLKPSASKVSGLQGAVVQGFCHDPILGKKEMADAKYWGPGEGHGNLLQYSSLENPMDRGGWWATVHGVAKSGTCLK